MLKRPSNCTIRATPNVRQDAALSVATVGVFPLSLRHSNLHVHVTEKKPINCCQRQQLPARSRCSAPLAAAPLKELGNTGDCTTNGDTNNQRNRCNLLPPLPSSATVAAAIPPTQQDNRRSYHHTTSGSADPASMLAEVTMAPTTAVFASSDIQNTSTSTSTSINISCDAYNNNAENVSPTHTAGTSATAAATSPSAAPPTTRVVVVSTAQVAAETPSITSITRCNTTSPLALSNSTLYHAPQKQRRAGGGRTGCTSSRSCSHTSTLSRSRSQH